MAKIVLFCLEILPVICFYFIVLEPVWAEPNFEAGVKSYHNKDFKSALTYFEKAIKANPQDSDALYYLAVTLHQVGKSEAAKQAYMRIIQNFPDTNAAQNATAALSYLNPKYLQLSRQNQGSNNSSHSLGNVGINKGFNRFDSLGNTSADKLPDDARVYFERRGDSMMITAYINNRPIEMIFDSGAEEVSLGKNHLAGMQLSPPQGPPIGYARGVGAGGVQATWLMRGTIKVGQIERTNFPMVVQENMPTDPLLGQAFFKDFYYTIDNQGKSIHFVRKSSAGNNGGAGDRSLVPFRREGKEMVVNVEVNGKPIAMYFDTGAEQCVFTMEQLRQVGLQVPEDAQVGFSRGIAGLTKSYHFTVPRMRLGPVDKLDVPVSVVEDANMGHPLLGQTFFSDLRIEVDNGAQMLKVRR